MVSANTCSSAASACPEVKPGAGAPWISTERCRLKRVVSSAPAMSLIVTSVDSGTI